MVVIPALNEEASIARVVGEIPSDFISEVIVVDNGSTDGTSAIAREAGATVLREPKRGYGYACMRGIAHAVTQGASIIVFLDGDYSDFPREIPSIVEPIRSEGFDMVIGSRLLGRRERGAMVPHAIAGNRIATFLIGLLWGYWYTDLGPFRAVRSDAMERLAMTDTTYGWTVEMQIRAAMLGLRVKEVPVRYRKRIGRSKISGTLRGALLASAKITWTILRYRFARQPAPR